MYVCVYMNVCVCVCVFRMERIVKKDLLKHDLKGNTFLKTISSWFSFILESLDFLNTTKTTVPQKIF